MAAWARCCAANVATGEIYGKERWFVEMFYPLVQSRREHSALTPGGRAWAEEETAMPAPAALSAAGAPSGPQNSR